MMNGRSTTSIFGLWNQVPEVEPLLFINRKKMRRRSAGRYQCLLVRVMEAISLLTLEIFFY